MIILDTHIWIGYIDDPASLPKPALKVIPSGREQSARFFMLGAS